MPKCISCGKTADQLYQTNYRTKHTGKCDECMSKVRYGYKLNFSIDSNNLKACDLVTIYRVYVLKNKIDKKVFVGITSSELEWRLSRHRDCVTNKRYNKSKLYSHMKKCGADQFYMELLKETSDPAEAADLSQKFIEQYDSFRNGLNSGYRGRIGLHSSCASRSKLSLEQIKEIKQKLLAGVTQKNLAKEYGVNQSTISHLKRQDTWNNLEVDSDEVKLIKNMSNLDYEVVIELYNQGFNQPEIAAKLSTTQSVISRILKKLRAGNKVI